MSIDFNRYYIWANRDSEHYIHNLLTDVPNKAVIFGPEECDVAHDWGRVNVVPESIDLTVITGAATEPPFPYHAIPLNANLILWPTFWMSKTYQDIAVNQVEYTTLPIDKLYISLNNRSKYHRCLLMDQLHHHNLIKYGHVSWHMTDAVDYHWQHWKPVKLVVEPNNSEWSMWSTPKVYHSTLFNLITESNTHTVFITEKTCIAMLYKKPYMVLGARGFHKVLKDMGFELYDELFDYSFDNNLKLNSRVNGIIENINNLKDQDYNLLRQRVKDKTEHNYNRIIELATTRKNVPDFMLNYMNTLKENPMLVTPHDMNYLELEKLLTL